MRNVADLQCEMRGGRAGSVQLQSKKNDVFIVPDASFEGSRSHDEEARGGVTLIAVIETQTAALMAVGGNAGRFSYLDSAERYDRRSNTWQSVASMGMAREGPGLAVSEANLVFAVGGYNSELGILRSAEFFDPETGAWEAVADMCSPRQNLGCAFLGGKLFAVGGTDDRANCLSTVEAYDPATGIWSAAAPMLVSRSGHGVCAHGGCLYALGGEGPAGGGYMGGSSLSVSLSSVERYDPALDAWTAVAPLRLGRRGVRAAVVAGKIYAVGGRGLEGGSSTFLCNDTVERYDPAAGSWEAVAPLTTARQDAGVAALDGAIYVVGGEGNAGLLRTAERLDIARNVWECLANPAPHVEQAHGRALIAPMSIARGGMTLVGLK